LGLTPNIGTTKYMTLGTDTNHLELDNGDIYINKIQLDATVCRCIFTAKLLYMFRVYIAPIIRSISNSNCSFWCISHVRPTNFRQRGHAGGRLLLWHVIWPVPEAAVTF